MLVNPLAKILPAFEVQSIKYFLGNTNIDKLKDLLPLPKGNSHIQQQQMMQSLRSQDYGDGIGYATQARDPENKIIKKN